MIKKFFAALLVMTLLPIQAFAEDSIQGKTYADRVNGTFDKTITNQQVNEFLDQLKEAVKKNDSDAAAKLVSYPCRFFPEKRMINITNAKQFKKLYPKIMTEDRKKTILATNLDDLFVNSQGFMIDDARIWFIPGKGIITFN